MSTSPTDKTLAETAKKLAISANKGKGKDTGKAKIDQVASQDPSLTTDKTIAEAAKKLSTSAAKGKGKDTGEGTNISRTSTQDPSLLDETDSEKEVNNIPIGRSPSLTHDTGSTSAPINDNVNYLNSAPYHETGSTSWMDTTPTIASDPPDPGHADHPGHTRHPGHEDHPHQEDDDIPCCSVDYCSKTARAGTDFCSDHLRKILSRREMQARARAREQQRTIDLFEKFARKERKVNNDIKKRSASYAAVQARITEYAKRFKR